MPEPEAIALITAAVLMMLMTVLYGVVLCSVQILRLADLRRTQREQSARIEAYLHDAGRPYDWSVDGL